MSRVGIFTFCIFSGFTHMCFLTFLSSRTPMVLVLSYSILMPLTILCIYYSSCLIGALRERSGFYTLYSHTQVRSMLRMANATCPHKRRDN
ncbi:hypothetical protein DER44DRAFT_799827 [Fusarium oxysporum]|nr:hypothetical protein DER44DRAFT_799827 [Fusarium oxysporum]